jgi:hypothetical protein
VPIRKLNAVAREGRADLNGFIFEFVRNGSRGSEGTFGGAQRQPSTDFPHALGPELSAGALERVRGLIDALCVARL